MWRLIVLKSALIEIAQTDMRPTALSWLRSQLRSMLERVLQVVFQTRHAISPGLTFRQFRKAVIFVIANHVLDKLPIYRIRYWYLRRVCHYKIGRHTSISSTTFFTGDLLEIGDHTIINRQCYLDGREGLYIGSNVSISNQAYIQTATHDFADPDFRYVPGPVRIGDYAWIGARATILPGVAIGQGAVVGAGAVVTQTVAPYSIVAGVPARVIGERPRNQRYQLDFFPFFDTDCAPYFPPPPPPLAKS
jgi:acetyltransferase-like isoleucine patch superfamily enzyme